MEELFKDIPIKKPMTVAEAKQALSEPLVLGNNKQAEALKILYPAGKGKYIVRTELEITKDLHIIIEASSEEDAIEQASEIGYDEWVEDNEDCDRFRNMEATRITEDGEEI